MLIEFHAAIFAWFLCSFGTPSRSLVGCRKMGGMPLHDTVVVYFKNGATADIKAKVPSVCAKRWYICRYVLDGCARVM